MSAERPAATTRDEWTMPEWMEPFRESFENTGGNTIERLMNVTTQQTRTNVILAALAVSVESQVTLLHRLKRRGLLAGVDPDA